MRASMAGPAAHLQEFPAPSDGLRSAVMARTAEVPDTDKPFGQDVSRKRRRTRPRNGHDSGLVDSSKSSQRRTWPPSKEMRRGLEMATRWGVAKG